MKAEIILFPLHALQLLILPLPPSVLSFGASLSPYCPLEAEAQLYSRGAKRTDVGSAEEKAHMNKQSPAASCKFDSQITKKSRKMRKYIKHRNKYSLCMLWCYESLPSTSLFALCSTRHFVCFSSELRMLILPLERWSIIVLNWFKSKKSSSCF